VTFEDPWRIGERSGIQPHLIEYANIREQCAFVHEGFKKEATAKALALIGMAVERARRIEPLRPQKVKVEKKVLVVGGGVSGMTASLRLAEQGYDVHLLEREKELGGNLREAFHTLRGSDPQVFLKDLIKQVEGQPLIHLYFGSEVIGSKGKTDIIGLEFAIRERRRFWTMGLCSLPREAGRSPRKVISTVRTVGSHPERAREDDSSERRGVEGCPFRRDDPVCGIER